MHLSVCAIHLFNANVSALKRGDFLPLHNANLSERVCVCVTHPLGPGLWFWVKRQSALGGFCCNETKGKHE